MVLHTALFIIVPSLEQVSLKLSFWWLSSFICLVKINADVLLVSSEVTHYELLMGEHLRVWSETEYTNAGEVMQNVGKLQEEDAKARWDTYSVRCC